MAHQEKVLVFRGLVDLTIERGPEGIAFASRLHHAMQIQREQALKAEFHQRFTGRQCYANGFKPKTLNTRVGTTAQLCAAFVDRWDSPAARYP